ncbi:MAG: IS21-like element helper ATPase IstB [Desulfarculus sp.]|nr:IS21-like element helper ATPase IstB [Pseudomonadota bacterium]MBV1718203.1 IS21-like element helper ATPase IstB [Desulfarculus sp.]MBU4575199.1 IS21-like element helper ATPase IstB [Pseudomonadota bacterium]MBU4597762.1 IS21-like element helper ATPase IstB [Pseudomonadota bacterium]MBV1737975.1 IS21-like element helper ATPase IstB [Desulfarculus sp.]
MSSFKNAPDIMGEALGRFPINPQFRGGKVVKMSPESPNRASLLLDKVKTMRLTGMAAALEEQMAASPEIPLQTVLHLERMVAREEALRTQRRLAARVKKAGLNPKTTLEGIDYSHPRDLDRGQISRLATCGWVSKGNNVIISGTVGSGKTYLAGALSHAACMQGYKVLFRRLPDLLREIDEARAAKGGRDKFLEGLAKLDLLGLDDWGLEMLDPQQGMDLLEVIEMRHRTKSTLVASCLPLERWVGVMDNRTIGAAVMDRLVHKAHHLCVRGDSLRREYSGLV